MVDGLVKEEFFSESFRPCEVDENFFNYVKQIVTKILLWMKVVTIINRGVIKTADQFLIVQNEKNGKGKVSRHS